MAVIWVLATLGVTGPAFGDDSERVKIQDGDNLPPAQRKGPVRLRSGQFYPVGNTVTNLARARATVPAATPVHVMMHFDRWPDRSAHGPLALRGVKLLEYLPERTYYAVVPPTVTGNDLSAAGVRWCGSVEAADKMPARIRTEGVGQWAQRAAGTVDLNVRYFPDVTPEAAIQSLQALGATILSQADPLRRVTINIPESWIEQLAAADCVRWIEEVPPPPTTNNDGSRVNTQAEIVQAAPYGLNGAGVVLGIWDGGNPDPNHDDFAGRLTLGQVSSVDDHATHVAGTMAGSGILSQSRGGTPLQWRGMSPAASIVSYDFNGDTISEHNPAINTFGISGSQNSWGFVVDEGFFNNCSLYGDYSTTAPEYDQIVTGLFGKRISVFFAAGNERDDGDCGLNNGAPDYINYHCLGPPGTAKNMVTVGAINSDDNSITEFSSWGPTDDGRVKPDICAPGCERGGEGYIHSTLPGDTYGGPGWCGTSMACPAASGCAGLLIQDFKSNNSGQEPLPSTVKALMIHTALDLDDTTSYFNPGPDYASGYGRLQVRDAIEQERANGFVTGQVANGATNSFSLSVPAGTTNVKVTLVWDDPAGAENAAVALVNDLDLVVLDPNKIRHFPWTLDPNNPSADAVRTSEDHLNNVEQVFVESAILVPGLWTVSVVGRSVPVSSPQGFTLVFTPAAGASGMNVGIEQTLVDDSAGGDGDGFVDSGERIALGIVLSRPDEPTNVLKNISAVLSTVTPGITVTQASSTYPDMPASAVATNVTPFGFIVGSNVVCGSQIEFSLQVSSDDGFVTLGFVLDIGNTTNIYLNTLESGLGVITVDNTGNGLWHLTGRRGSDTGHSRTNSMYYGLEGTNSATYNTGSPNRGAFTTAPISLVGAQGRVLFTFQHLLDREESSPANYDVAKLEISNNGGVSFTTLAGPYSGTDKTFRRETVDLTAYRGYVVQLRFSFDTVDHVANDFEGWYVDDLTIRSFSCGESQVSVPADIVAQGMQQVGSNTIVNVHDGTSGASRLSQAVLTGQSHSDIRSFASDAAGTGVDVIVASGVRVTGLIDFEVLNGQTGSNLVTDALSPSATTPYAAGQADVAGTTAAELLFVASGLAGPSLDVRNGTTGASTFDPVDVLGGAACSTFQIVPADVDGNTKKEIVVLGERTDGLLVADVRSGISGAQISAPSLRSIHGAFQAFAIRPGSSLLEQVAILTGEKSGYVLTMVDLLGGKAKSRNVLKKAVGPALALPAKALSTDGSQVILIGSTEHNLLAVEVHSGKGKRVRSFELSTQVTGPIAAVGADIDGDGRDEVVISATQVSDGKPVLIALDANTGGSLYLTEMFEGTSVSNINLFAADVDGDGVQDVVTNAARVPDGRALFEVRAGVSGALFSAFDQGINFAGPNAAYGARVGD